MRVCFVMQSVSIGGGSYAILQHADYLSRHGHQVALAVVDPPDAMVREWHPALRALPCLDVEDAGRRTFDVVVATYWTSVEPALRLQARHHVYFVQSIESRFYPRARRDLRSAAEASYSLSLPVITEAAWIKDHLEAAYGSRVWLARNGIDRTVFNTDGPLAAPRRTKGLRVLVEGPLGVAFKNVPRTIRLAREASVAELWLLTSSPIASYPGVDRVFSRVSMARAAEVYRSCDVLLKLSLVEGMFGPPLEMFCCGGTAVVYKVSGFDEYIVPGVNALACDVRDDAAVVDSLHRLEADAELLRSLRAEAAATGSRWPDWSAASARFAECLSEIAEGPALVAIRPVGPPVEASLPAGVRAPSTRRAKWKDAVQAFPRLRRAAVALRLSWWAHVASRSAPRGYGE